MNMSMRISNIIFKDLDYQENIGAAEIINKKYIMDILERDVEFLVKHNLMDYSLMLGLYLDNVTTYQMGIIDYL